MGNHFKNGPKILKLIVSVCIYHILIRHLEKKIVDLKTGFLRIFFGRFIEVKRTIPLFVNVINIKLGRQINISFIPCF